MPTFRIASAILLALCPMASGFSLAGARAPACRAHVRMQTLIPDAPTITKPDALPETWDVPDTFCFTDRLSSEPPFFKVTLFKSSQFELDYVVGAIVKVTGVEDSRAKEIGKQAQTMGFATIGEYVQEVAEMYGAGLKDKGLVVDVSPVAC